MPPRFPAVLAASPDIPNVMRPRNPFRRALTSAALLLAVLGLVRPAAVQAAANYYDFSTDPNIAGAWANNIYYTAVGTATWNSTNQNLGLACNAGLTHNQWSVLHPTDGTRGATDPVTMTINSASATGTDWALVGLVISSDTAPTLAGTNPRYVFILATDTNAGNWYYQVKRSPSSGAALYKSANIPYASLTFPIRLDIVRNGASYDFKFNGSTVYTASYYTSAQHDSMVYYHITWGKGANNSAMTATVDNFGVPDTTPPTVSTLSPANSATGVSLTDNLVVTFNKAIAIGTGNITVKNLTDATQSTIAITDGSQVSVAGSVLTINPTADLTPGKDYAIRIDATAIKDLSGNSFAGIADDTTWNFTTISSDTTPPTVSILSPLDNATGVLIGSNLVVTFSEPIASGTGNITLNNLTDTIQSTIAITDGSQVSVSGSVLTINPSADLTLGKDYAIQIDATAVKDIAGNFFLGIADNTTWNFTTEPPRWSPPSALRTTPPTWRLAATSWSPSTRRSPSAPATSPSRTSPTRRNRPSISPTAARCRCRVRC